MSAFLVGGTHIDALVTAGLLMPDSKPLRWLWSPAQLDAEVDYQRGSQGADDGQERRRELAPATAERVGSMLFAENVHSMAYRYPDDDSSDGGYEFQELPGDFRDSRVRGVVRQALDCYEYQSCEHPGWERSEAKAFCNALRAVVGPRLLRVPQMPAWPITDRELFLKLTSR